MDQQLPNLAPRQLPPPVLEDQSSQRPSQPKEGKALAIALIVSMIFLLAAAGITVWLLIRPAGTSTITQQPTGDGSESVTSLSFVPPQTLPVAYTARQQHTPTAAATYFYDPATSCGITTRFAPLTAERSKPKEAALALAEAAYAYGVTTTAVSDGSKHIIKDTDGTHQYDFASFTLDQTVAIQGVGHDKQRTTVAYKQFGAHVASLAYGCKTESWEAKQPELAALVAAFNVKTER